MRDSNTEFIVDPTGHMLAVVDDEQRADRAGEDLRAAGFEEVRIYRGEVGAEAIDARGVWHGVVAHLLRLAQEGLTNKDSMAEYEHAVREGASVVSLRVSSGDDRRAQACHILDDAGARAINYYGPLVVETQKP
jgi:hypothetical protein